MTLPSETHPTISVVVPTLNEERYVRLLLSSIEKQHCIRCELLIVDGGSNDRTVEIARHYGARVIVLPGLSEFASRNIGAEKARGELLLFTCADVIFPINLLRKVAEKFDEDPELVALAGPGYPFDASILGKIEYKIYDVVRTIFARSPRPIKRFSTSTNFLVVKAHYFPPANPHLR